MSIALPSIVLLDSRNLQYIEITAEIAGFMDKLRANGIGIFPNPIARPRPSPQITVNIDQFDFSHQRDIYCRFQINMNGEYCIRYADI